MAFPSKYLLVTDIIMRLLRRRCCRWPWRNATVHVCAANVRAVVRQAAAGDGCSPFYCDVWSINRHAVWRFDDDAAVLERDVLAWRCG